MHKRNSFSWVTMKTSKSFVENNYISLTKIKALFISLYIFIFNIQGRIEGLILISVARSFSLKYWWANGFSVHSFWISFCMSYLVLVSHCWGVSICYRVLIISPPCWSQRILGPCWYIQYSTQASNTVNFIWCWAIVNSCKIFLSSFLEYR